MENHFIGAGGNRVSGNRVSGNQVIGNHISGELLVQLGFIAFSNQVYKACGVL